MSDDVRNPQQFRTGSVYSYGEVTARGVNDPFPEEFAASVGGRSAAQFRVRDLPIDSAVARKIQAEHIDAQAEGNGDLDQVRDILNKGVDSMPPVLANPDGVVFDGGHRLHAAHLAGRKTISAFVMEPKRA